MIGCLILAGSINAALVTDAVTITVQGLALNTNGNTAGIKAGERVLYLDGRTLHPALRAMIKASGGKPADMILRVASDTVTVIADISSKRVKEQGHAHTVFKHCFGFVAHDDGTNEYFCKGQTCEVLGKAINTFKNRVNIGTDDVCYLMPDNKTIRCLSGIVIKNPIQQESALTGTPGYLNSGQYIGFMVTKPSTPLLMGSGKRIDFYAWPTSP